MKTQAKRIDFHEDFGRERLEPPSERSTGLVFAGVAALLGAFHYETASLWLPCLILALALVSLSWKTPRLLRPLNLLWFRFSLALSRLVNPIVMLVLYVLVIVPFGLAMRLVRDPLQAGPAREAKSYWTERAINPQPSSMRDQF